MTDLRDTCPKCGGETTFGYGLAGGGIGPYVHCLEDGCDFFEKSREDVPEEEGEDG